MLVNNVFTVGKSKRWNIYQKIHNQSCNKRLLYYVIHFIGYMEINGKVKLCHTLLILLRLCRQGKTGPHPTACVKGANSMYCKNTSAFLYLALSCFFSKT